MGHLVIHPPSNFLKLVPTILLEWQAQVVKFVPCASPVLGHIFLDQGGYISHVVPLQEGGIGTLRSIVSQWWGVESCGGICQRQLQAEFRAGG